MFKLTRSLIYMFSASFFMLACQQGGSAPEAISPDAKFAANASFAVLGPVITDCNFNNTLVLEGSSITAYQNSNVLSGATCASEVRTCNSGLLSGSYNYNSCSVNSPASCLFNGLTVAHGSSIEAYSGSSVDLGAECIFEMRTCNNGVLSGSNQYASCGVNLPTSCLFNGQTIADGQSVSAYLGSSVGFGELCSVETRFCINGALSGSNQYGSCSVNSPSSCLFNGQTIADGQSVNAFLNSTVTFGETCLTQARICQNGVLSGSNQFASCSVDSPASCLFNGQTIVHGSSLTAYRNSNTSSGELCNAEERFCDNGQLAGSYQFASCSIDQAASCLFNGQTVADGSSIIAFASSSVNFGESCISEARACTNGVLSGSGTFANCQVGAPASCLFNGQTVNHGQTIVGYESASVSSSQRCTSETKTCNNGSLSGAFVFQSCTIQATDDEDDDAGKKEKYCRKQHVEKKHHGNNRDNQSQNNRQDGHSDNGLHLGWYKEKHKEHYDCGKHLGWYKEKKKKKNTCVSKNKK